ncbi:histidinol-phosphatase HisJ [Mesobacillus maritimus]|uniref:histidinol-phosphatase HisJ n=1 Tax=Mesobacillus maritimus TaxID=1643336 RepID=UPI0020417377|nr:histidinol-phosphatase HisJ [Mesobacillus maritimus]MCM3670069.1 histidinol-phosphatase HisJ [Mesobacillus maritimus]
MRDGHVHTRFCPHGTNDSFEAYIERALALGYTEISFTEHAPLPDTFVDPTPQSDSAMQKEKLDDYFEEVSKLKAQYEGKVKINAGLEVDYIEGYEAEITQFLNEVGPKLDDAILSVHFLKSSSGYDCLDYSPNHFANMIQDYGSVEEIYRHYYQTLLKSILAELGSYKPKRIGHMTLVHKFQRKYPVQSSFDSEIDLILNAVKDHGYELDYNGAGTAKPLCREPYPPDAIVHKAKERGIPLVYGSDAHQAKELGQGYERIKRLANL